MLLKKKEVIAASLVVLIGLAGYLNWSYQDTVRVSDNDSYVETGKILGEAEMVSADNETEEKDDETESEETAAEAPVENAASFEEAKANRESARAAAMEALKAASKDESVDDATRKLAGERLVKCAENIELESNVENVCSAKGYQDVCVYINEGTAVVTIKCDGISAEDASIITDAVTSTANISPAAVKLIEVR